ncbi:conserved oligomeric Golgi complex subunit 6 [Paraclostridium bifermentans]|uniref:hypothetical protein n=1 Tax=Paraclostridium bifermentans TaxID=1490 RepID=UPI00374E3671
MTPSEYGKLFVNQYNAAVNATGQDDLRELLKSLGTSLQEYMDEVETFKTEEEFNELKQIIEQKENTIKDITSDCNNLKFKLEELNGEKTDLEEKLEVSDNENETVKEENQRLKTKIESLNNEIKDLGNKLESKENSYDKLKNELAQVSNPSDIDILESTTNGIFDSKLTEVHEMLGTILNNTEIIQDSCYRINLNTSSTKKTQERLVNYCKKSIDLLSDYSEQVDENTEKFTEAMTEFNEVKVTSDNAIEISGEAIDTAEEANRNSKFTAKQQVSQSKDIERIQDTVEKHETFIGKFKGLFR